jgi:hypothetical protein
VSRLARRYRVSEVADLPDEDEVGQAVGMILVGDVDPGCGPIGTSIPKGLQRHGGSRTPQTNNFIHATVRRCPEFGMTAPNPQKGWPES